MICSVRYQPILHTLYYTPHIRHAYFLSYHFLNNIVITTIIEMVEMIEILDGRLDQVINNLLHLFIVKYGDISLVLCISSRLRLVTILSLLVKYLVIFHADPYNNSSIYHSKSRLNTPVRGSLRSPNSIGECGSTLCRIVRYSSEPNTKVYRMWPHPLSIFSFFFYG